MPIQCRALLNSGNYCSASHNLFYGCATRRCHFYAALSISGPPYLDMEVLDKVCSGVVAVSCACIILRLLFREFLEPRRRWANAQDVIYYLGCIAFLIHIALFVVRGTSCLDSLDPCSPWWWMALTDPSPNFPLALFAKVEPISPPREKLRWVVDSRRK